jgi:MacB-like periplasmic core domain
VTAPQPRSLALRLSGVAIRLASVLVPATARRDWQREWNAETLHALKTLRGRGDRRAGARVLWFAVGAFSDAIWHLNLQGRENLTRSFSNQAQSGGFCLASLAGLVLAIALASGFLPNTRSVLMPLPYADAGRIAVVAHTGIAPAARSGVQTAWVRMWKHKSRLLEGAATYVWQKAAVKDRAGRTRTVVSAQVSDNFFSLLGARTAAGKRFSPGEFRDCSDCVVLSYDMAQRVPKGGSILLGKQRYRVAGVLDKRFWFLSRRIAVWRISSGLPPKAESSNSTGVVVRLGLDVRPSEAEVEMEKIVQASGLPPWDSLVEVAPLEGRVRSVFGSFALALGLASVVVAVSMRPRLPKWNPRGAIVFGAKTLLLLAIVLTAGIEFTRASAITMIGGTDALTEPLSLWLFLMGSMGVLTWSIQDQRRRCRVCLRRLGLAQHVGCPGCLLLDWAGTELVCVEGHGMLHVPEMVASWQDPAQWTALDESWQGLFDGARR